MSGISAGVINYNQIPYEIESAIDNWTNDKSKEAAKQVHLAIISNKQTNASILYSKINLTMDERKELCRQINLKT